MAAAAIFLNMGGLLIRTAHCLDNLAAAIHTLLPNVNYKILSRI
jgi:hypothetical protein